MHAFRDFGREADHAAVHRARKKRPLASQGAGSSSSSAGAARGGGGGSGGGAAGALREGEALAESLEKDKRLADLFRPPVKIPLEKGPLGARGHPSN